MVDVRKVSGSSRMSQTSEGLQGVAWHFKEVLDAFKGDSVGSECFRGMTWGSRGLEGNFGDISGSFRGFSVGSRDVT